MTILRSRGVMIEGEIDQLVRNHGADNCGKFSDFASAIARQLRSSESTGPEESPYFHFEGKELPWDVPTSARNRKNCNSEPNILSWSYMNFSCVVFSPTVSLRWNRLSVPGICAVGFPLRYRLPSRIQDNKNRHHSAWSLKLPALRLLSPNTHMQTILTIEQL